MAPDYHFYILGIGLLACW